MSMPDAGAPTERDDSAEDLSDKSDPGPAKVGPEVGNGVDIEKQDQDSLPRQQIAEQPSVAEQDVSLVDFDSPDDLENPRNWKNTRKANITCALAAMTFAVTFSSSIFATAAEPVAQEFGISRIVATLGIPVAVARNVETIMLGRFLSGFAASAPLAVVGGALADMLNPIERAYAVCVFSTATFCGPVVGPVVGGFVTESHLGWRWTAWLTVIMAGIFGTYGILVVPETSAQRILQSKAKRLRYKTRNWALHAKADESPITVDTIVRVYLQRPWKMIVEEPILALMTAYMSYIYGVLYLLFEAYPISFHDERGWSLGVSALPFISFLIGTLAGQGIIVYSTATNFKRSFLKHGKPIPEERLPPMMVGAVVLPIGLFWFAWTSDPKILWVPQVISSAFIGMGVLITFWQGMNYIMDCYGFYTNSAVTVNTFIRSIAGAGFPLFAPIMYKRLGVSWATSVLAFICVAFLPAPFIFAKYGARIRAKSRFAPTV